jgi:hypothetical protein
MSRLHHDDVSFTEAIDRYRKTMDHPMDSPCGGGKPFEVDLLYGEYAWWKPTVIKGGLDKIIDASEVDDEMVELIRTAIPYSIQGFFTGFFNLLDVALIGYLVGTEEACIFVVVSLLTWLPTTFMYGFFEALARLVPGTVEDENDIRRGSYVNASVALFTVGMVPVGVLWSYVTEQTFLWLGFDAGSAELAQQYAYIQVVLEWVTGVGYCLHLFLDVIGHERYSTYLNLAFGVGQTLGVVVQSLAGQNSLIYVGLCRTVFACSHVLASSFFAICCGWLDEYTNGIVDMPFRVRFSPAAYRTPLLDPAIRPSSHTSIPSPSHLFCTGPISRQGGIPYRLPAGRYVLFNVRRMGTALIVRRRPGPR